MYRRYQRPDREGAAEVGSGLDENMVPRILVEAAASG
jgi:hypothetical protein